jgi:phage host-nuclease inhibitor protein Gam
MERVIMVKNLQEANDLLAKIGEKKRAIAVVKSRYDAQMAEIRKKMDKETQADNEALLSMESDLFEFMRSTPNLFDKKKTVELAFGALTSRKTPDSIQLDAAENWDIVLEKLKLMRLHKCIQVKKSPNKTAMKKLSEEELEQLGVRKVFDIKYDYRTI